MRGGGLPVRAARCLSLLLYSPAQDGKHIKCFPLRAELATNLIYFAAPPPKLERRHVDVCLTLLAQLITLLGVHYLLEGELALHWLAFCLWLRLIEIEDHDGTVGEFCWELEALWGCSLDELAAGAAVTYC